MRSAKREATCSLVVRDRASAFASGCCFCLKAAARAAFGASACLPTTKKARLPRVTGWALAAVGGFIMGIAGFALFALVGGVEAGYQGNERLAELGVTLTICGCLVLFVGVAGLVVTAIARRARGESANPERDHDQW